MKASTILVLALAVCWANTSPEDRARLKGAVTPLGAALTVLEHAVAR